MPLNTCTVYRTQQPVFSSFTVHTAFIWTLAASSILNYKKDLNKAAPVPGSSTKTFTGYRLALKHLFHFITTPDLFVTATVKLHSNSQLNTRTRHLVQEIQQCQKSFCRASPWSST